MEQDSRRLVGVPAMWISCGGMEDAAFSLKVAKDLPP
jgi:hypothetical protein